MERVPARDLTYTPQRAKFRIHLRARRESTWPETCTSLLLGRRAAAVHPCHETARA
ncbi:hypothetical protein PISMIDRAFT_139971 [Pisolithus microcarpus 441]|uniref:Uncharacterized protein n=1 Tax=Pisolithus microcarpus 441 TaxID=765257 RepID=A0A0D0AGT5_9AGAM|nr:hypothetical protein PISMIDRAFT_139971 [Pisolithus microcarpus 441]